MYTYHLTLANYTLLFCAGSMIVAGMACVLSSQIGVLADFFKGRGR